MQRLPDVLLSKMALDLFLTGTCKLRGQVSVADDLCDCFSERRYITYREKQSSFAIRDDVHYPSRASPYHRFAGRLCFQDHRGQTFPVAGKDYDIGGGIVRSRVLYCPGKNHARICVQWIASFNWKWIAILETTHKKQPKFRVPMTELCKSIHQLRNAFVTRKPPNKQGNG